MKLISLKNKLYRVAILGDVTLHNSNFLFQNVKRYALFYRAYLLLIDRKMLVT